MSDSEDRKQAKAWRRRNSDGILGFPHEGRNQQPPAFRLDRYTNAGASFTDDADPEHEAHAVRHVHVFDPSLEDPDA